MAGLGWQNDDKASVHTPSAPNWIRTSNPPIKSRLLYQLSYRGKIYTAPAATSHKGATPRMVPASPTAATAYFDGACITAMWGHVPVRRVSLLSFHISRPVGLVPSQDSNAGGLPVGLLRFLGGVCRVGDLEIIESLEVSDIIRHWGGHLLVKVGDVEHVFC